MTMHFLFVLYHWFKFCHCSCLFALHFFNQARQTIEHLSKQDFNYLAGYVSLWGRITWLTPSLYHGTSNHADLPRYSWDLYYSAQPIGLTRGNVCDTWKIINTNKRTHNQALPSIDYRYASHGTSVQPAPTNTVLMFVKTCVLWNDKLYSRNSSYTILVLRSFKSTGNWTSGLIDTEKAVVTNVRTNHVRCLTETEQV